MFPTTDWATSPVGASGSAAAWCTVNICPQIEIDPVRGDPALAATL